MMDSYRVTLPHLEWNPIVPPNAGVPVDKMLLLTGDSGYGLGFKKFLCLGFIRSDQGDSLVDASPAWRNVQDDYLSDCGWQPTHWARWEFAWFPPQLTTEQALRQARTVDEAAHILQVDLSRDTPAAFSIRQMWKALKG